MLRVTLNGFVLSFYPQHAKTICPIFENFFWNERNSVDENAGYIYKEIASNEKMKRQRNSQLVVKEKSNLISAGTLQILMSGQKVICMNHIQRRILMPPGISETQ